MNMNTNSIYLNEQLMEEVREHISESLKVLERKMKSEFRIMVQDQSLGVSSRGSISGSTGAYATLHHIMPHTIL